MESTPPSHLSELPRSQLKSASRLARLALLEDAPSLSLDLAPPSSPKASTLSPSPRPQSHLPLQELLLLSPSPLRRSKTRLAEKLDLAEEHVEPNGSRRKCKSRNASICASPRNARRSRRRMEAEIREEREVGLGEEMGKVRKRRHSGRSKKDKLSLVVSVPSPKTSDGDRGSLDRIGSLMTDLIMWNDVAKSSLWFGFGCLCFLSSGLAGGIDFSIFSLMSQVGLLFLGLSFLSNSICKRGNVENSSEFKLKEDDVLRAARLILPTLNLAISVIRKLFSGEPTMTLKVAPLLLIGAEYGHLITLRRLCAFGFFTSFTCPKLYSCYSVQTNHKAQSLIKWMLEAWGACSHKKIVAASAATAFWNLSAARTRIFAAFIFLVMLRYYKQRSQTTLEANEAEEGEQYRQKALVAVENGRSI